jgi:hypothetical protein
MSYDGKLMTYKDSLVKRAEYAKVSLDCYIIDFEYGPRSETWSLDPGLHPTGHAHMCNHSSTHPNVSVTRPRAADYSEDRDPTIWLLAIRNIEINDELFWNYKDPRSGCSFLE